MFTSKRRRAAPNPPLNGSNANANATTAAAQAFLKSQASNASLAAAAAGAALRSNPMTPTSVADVQTKRTIRRAGSTSSMGSSISGSRGPAGAQLERRGSAGSMTERTFRDPSPARLQPVPSAIDAPPVPAIPKTLQQTQSAEAGSHRRAASMEAPTMRVASPPPKMTGGRGSSLGPPTISQNPRKAGQRMSNLPSVQETLGVERPASRGSVNFSLPTSYRPESPIAQRRLTSHSPSRVNPARIISPTNQKLIYDPNTRTFLPEAEILAIEQKVQDAANIPIKKKKRIAPQQATGTHLAAGTVGGRLRGTAIEEMEASTTQHQHPVESAAHIVHQTPAPAPIKIPSAAPDPPTLAPPARRKKKAATSDSESDQAPYQLDSSDTESDIPRKPKNYKPRAGGLLAKRPSVVREDRAREEEEDDTPPRPRAQESAFPKLEPTPEVRTVSPSPLPRPNVGNEHSTGEVLSSATYSEGLQSTMSASPPLSPTDSSPTRNGVGLVTRDSVRGGRVQSISPARTTHFATAPESMVVKHQPPARAASPRKSAMKHSHSSSPRGPSPVGLDVSEGSNLSTVDDQSVPRKKANRVSFDDTNVVVGTAAPPILSDSPIVASPQTKRPWFGIGRGKRKENSSILDDDDEVMTPRPALPSFGSVRDKKAPREAEPERPLVKPTETVEYQPLEPTSPPIYTSPTGEVIENPLGQSNDHAVGFILSQEATSKNAANISKSREPLPPQVTSVEGNGYLSESDTSVDGLESEKTKVVSEMENVKLEPENGHVGTRHPIPNPSSEAKEDVTSSTNGHVGIPEISIEQPTPTLDSSTPKEEWQHMPGTWADGTDSSNSDPGEDRSPVIATTHHATEPTIADLGISEPAPVLQSPGTPHIGEIALQNAIPAIAEEPEESEADSIYSDAVEDLSDAEGDGFMSLDAVVDSPVSNGALPGLAVSTPPESPTTMLTKERAYRKSELSQNGSEPTLDEGWDKVQNYWSTLTADKKRELEQQAREDEEGSDTEVEIKPKPKLKKKKAVVQAAPVDLPAYQQQAPSANNRQYMIQPGARAGPNGHAPTTMKSSMRADPRSTATEPHIRKSMRGATSMRGSLRGSSESAPQPKGSLQKKYRPMSYPSPEIKADPAAVQMHVRALSVASAANAGAAAARDMAPRPKPTLRRKGSGDSESSFKRARPAGETPGMRTSMRASTKPERRQSPIGSSRFSLRSLSPTGSGFRRPFGTNAQSTQSPSAPAQMRTSMRSSHTTTPTMRTPTSRSTPFGRSGSNKPSKIKTAPKKTSRFADSSDEEDDRPTFQSRFVDSSDDDEPAPLRNKSLRTPQRPIGIQDGDSSDLPDSDDEKHVKPAKKQNGTTSASAQGATLASGSLRRSGSGRETMASPVTSPRPIHTRRGSFMSSILRRKKDPSSKVRKSDAESPARRDTPLERSKSDLAVLRAGEVAPKSPQPKLQKRNTGSRQNSFTSAIPPPNKTEGWPLTAAPLSAEGEGGRPETADGVVPTPAVNGNGEKPSLGARRFTATGLSGVDVGLGEDDEKIEVGKKKKKFGKLRRMFRLDE